ncbi:MAG: hypothetical protein K2Q97_16210, partial [Burkholderiaceae bacterium]|nr:hypothetical protein [Burkholderiaceae bacterium]
MSSSEPLPNTKLQPAGYPASVLAGIAEQGKNTGTCASSGYSGQMARQQQGHDTAGYIAATDYQNSHGRIVPAAASLTAIGGGRQQRGTVKEDKGSNELPDQRSAQPASVHCRGR